WTDAAACRRKAARDTCRGPCPGRRPRVVGRPLRSLRADARQTVGTAPASRSIRGRAAGYPVLSGAETANSVERQCPDRDQALEAAFGRQSEIHLEWEPRLPTTSLGRL